MTDDRERRERRHPRADDDEVLSPETVAVLLMCGAEVREADRERLDGEHRRPQSDRRRPERRRRESY